MASELVHDRTATIPRLLDLDATAYHADGIDSDRPSLSASVASTLIRQSPFHAWLKHPRLGNTPREASSEMERGTIIHGLVFGTLGGDDYETIDADNFRTKAAQEQRDAARDRGAVPVLAREMETYRRVAEAIGHKLREAGIDLNGVSEKVAAWEEASQFGPVLCRGMIDHLIIGNDGATIYDLKNCRNAHPESCVRHVLEYGYEIQRAAYVSAVEKLRPDLAGRVRFVWLFVEELPGYRVVLTVAEASGTLRELGESRWARAVETWAKCLRMNEWPAYGSARLEAPDWALKQEEGQ